MSLGKAVKYDVIFTKHRKKERSYTPKNDGNTPACGKWWIIYEVINESTTKIKTNLETGKINVSSWSWGYELIEVLKS